MTRSARPSRPLPEVTVPQLPLALTGLVLHLLGRLRGDDTERGDVPGWVLITLMTAGLVTVIWAAAGPALTDMFTNALDGVTGPGTGAKP